MQIYELVLSVSEDILTLYFMLISYLKHMSLLEWLIWGCCHWIMQSFLISSHLTVIFDGGMSFSEMI